MRVVTANFSSKEMNNETGSIRINFKKNAKKALQFQHQMIKSERKSKTKPTKGSFTLVDITLFCSLLDMQIQKISKSPIISTEHFWIGVE